MPTLLKLNQILSVTVLMGFTVNNARTVKCKAAKSVWCKVWRVCRARAGLSIKIKQVGLLLGPGGEFAFVAFGEAFNQGIITT
ncbi:hypothetical protein L1987_12999 [Smallanthus sonchifolius]|uniref:Uncharacterized protein n=1 Tax=Smallanthus sonchifolius TaxID=185202 RepID=A0ACB9JFD0_9ASTR|nr:hypothetical protein L1987_12999 [Smallanthus sonchifolius]